MKFLKRLLSAFFFPRRSFIFVALKAISPKDRNNADSRKTQLIPNLEAVKPAIRGPITHAMLIKVLSKGIKKAGFDTEEVMSGLKVVSAAKKFKPDLILLDIILPGLDGFGVLKLLKSDKTLKKIPVVVLSNLDKPADVISAKALGSVQYIIKANTKIDEIIKIIKKTLKI